jgi:peptide/nickel transport system substrate-binding protein
VRRAHAVRGWASCLAAFGVVAVAGVTGCSGYAGIPSAGGAAELGSASDINPQDPATLRDGGDLKLAIGQYPPNWNILNIDGNLADTGAIMHPTMPRAFVVGPDGSTRVDTDFFTNVELTSTNPQVVTYTINPKAVWSDGTPITWEDIKAQIDATSGQNKSFAIAATSGADRVASVTRGVDDRQAIMTFAKPYSEWRGMFAGDAMLLPKTMNVTPDVFNTGALNGPGKSAGPFIITTLDKTAQRIVLTRNPRWWGTTPRLNSITFAVLDPTAVIPALQNGAIDAAGLASIDDVTVARRTKGVSIRRAPAPSWSHFTFNGAPGSILADKSLRLAVAKGIDRQTIASVTQRGLANEPAPLNNHIYVVGQKGYQNNSGPADYNPDEARRELDALGWKLNGKFREKNGRQLVVRDLIVDDQDTRQIGQIAQNSLAQIGVKLELDVKPMNGFFSNYVNTGDFDVTQFSWVGDAFPLSALTQIYASDGPSNFGKIGSSEIDAKIEETLSALDPDAARVVANQLDEMLWQEVFSLALTQSAGNEAVRSDLANFGPTGLADLNYTAIGFMK